ncbi:MAG: Mut7-C RNAse domain-containing protein, partial [candidate division NC10 bacterium]
MPPPHRFVADIMLGKLARWLRAMGYDTLYFRVAEDRHLLQLAHAEARTLLTRDTRLARLAGAGGLLIQATEVEPQVAEVIERLALHPSSDDL